ncbi:site-specific integrase [Pleionea litopenaei]|uniref:Site-specific integrase n=1 Tax=Pleionea litopenaei TaxID=3070815 RepID=A0AA51X726_9GAMM|nr:site-specific integrase [Pleionea sp. HL-JVS1]WMS87892.1 site-specific integrase [Pleionea sp. HL-JVS1]
MYSIKRFKFRNNDACLLFDDINPVMYALLYFSDRLTSKAPSTQYASFQAIKLFYQYWYAKFGVSFCNSFYQADHNPELAVIEFTDFYNGLCSRNPSHLNENTQMSPQTADIRAKAVIQFLEYLVDRYISGYYLDEPAQSINERRNCLVRKLKSHRESIKTGNHSVFGRPSQYMFKSLSREMVAEIYRIIQPDNLKKKNNLNPFKRKDIQLRNFLIIRLLLNYGLRVGELLLLEKQSIKTNITNSSYNLIISNLSDVSEDPRRIRPRIKSSYSVRVIELEKSDYEFLMIYMHEIRSQQCKHQILFSSQNTPFSPLTYESIRAVFKGIDRVFSVESPEFKDSNYVDSIESFTPHVARHTWATMTLSYLYKRIESERVFKQRTIHSNQSSVRIMDEAKEQLRTMGGWSLKSAMPDRYAKRFLSEQANKSNIQRIQADLSFGLALEKQEQ